MNDNKFLEGIQTNQKKVDQRLVNALGKAYHYGEDKEFIKGMTMALRVIRGESYDGKTLNMSKPVYEKLKDD